MEAYIEKYTKDKNISSKHTISSIRSNLRRVERVMDIKFDKWKISDFKNDEKVLEKLIEDYQLNSVIVSISALKSWLITKNAPEKITSEYDSIVRDLSREKSNIVNKQEKTSDEEELGEDFEWKQLTEKSRKFIKANMEDASKEKLRNLLILGFFSLQPPARIGNYLNMQVRSTKKKLPLTHNYLVRNGDGMKFIFNKYKTAKHIGQVELEVEDNLLKELLNKYIEKLPGKNPVLLNMSSSNVVSSLKKITKKFLNVGISVNTFRHSFLSDFLNSNPSIKEKERIAKIIGQKYRAPRMETYKRIN